MPYVPKRQFGRTAVGINGSVNMGFLTFLIRNKDMGIQFLKDVGLIHNKVPCNICGQDMTWRAIPTTRDGFRLQCRRKVAEAKCSQSKAFRHGSWFQQSSHRPGGTVLHIRNRAPRTSPPNPVPKRSRTGACSTERQCRCIWRDALKRPAVVTRPSKLTRACSVSENTIGGTLLRASGCSVVSNVSLAEHFLFQYLTEPLTP